MFSRSSDGRPSLITSFQASCGVIVDTGVFDVPVPAKLRLDAYFGEAFMGSTIAGPLGQPPFYEGVVAFSLSPQLGGFDRVVLTSMPVPEPGTLTLGSLGVAVLLLVAWRRERCQCSRCARASWSRQTGSALLRSSVSQLARCRASSAGSLAHTGASCACRRLTTSVCAPALFQAWSFLPTRSSERALRS